MNWIRWATNTYLVRREPISLVWFVTNRCNARCRHCFVDFTSSESSFAEPGAGEADQLARRLGGSLFNVNLTGGEPFLRGDLWDLLRPLLDHTTVRAVVITTNGSFPERVAALLERFRAHRNGCLLKLSISIDEAGEQHDRLRGITGLFERALQTYRIAEGCGDHRVLADVAITVTPWNCDTVLGLHRGLRALGVLRCAAILMRKAGTVREIPRSEAVLAAHGRLAEAIRAVEAGIRPRWSAHALLERLKAGKNKVVRDLASPASGLQPAIGGCVAGSLFGVIGHSGEVYPCEVLGPRWSFGNLRGHDWDFMALWGGKRATDTRARIASLRCGCTYECAWSTTVTATPRLAARALRHALGPPTCLKNP